MVFQGEKDWEKYEVARKLKTCVDAIRAQYQEDLKSKQMGIRQRAVALYFIDKVSQALCLHVCARACNQASDFNL